LVVKLIIDILENHIGLKQRWLTLKILEKVPDCIADFDGVCPVGAAVTRKCSLILKGMKQSYTNQNNDTTFRACLKNETWLRDNWRNYTGCPDLADLFDLTVVRS